METARNKIVSAVCLVVIVVATVVLLGARALGLELPDAAVRTLGVLDLIALPVLSYLLVKGRLK
ncbi:MAG: hypothetical protein NC543_12805 [bacterium]|nr:hypothetical protein [bacterium]MCM1374727.1 hypothetical protein [Muribaculum sp.]